MTIYIDEDFRCYAEAGDGLRAVETAFFDGKAPGYVAGYRFIPDGESWTAEDGTVYRGEAAFPAVDWEGLDKVQREYEREQIPVLTAQNSELVEAMAAMVEDIYESDLAVIEEG